MDQPDGVLEDESPENETAAQAESESADAEGAGGGTGSADADRDRPGQDPQSDTPQSHTQQSSAPKPDAAPGVALVDDETIALRDKVAALEARLKAVSAAYRQQQEEIQATKDRLARQASIKEEMRRGEVVGTLFEPVENLRRSITTLEREGMAEEAKGLKLVLHQFLEAFKKLGLEEVPGKGSRFDPNMHEALTTTPVTDPALDEVVVDVFDTGYRIGSRLLKPARVIIGAYQEPETVGEA